MKNKDTVLVISNQVVLKNSKVNWPDLNYPNSGQTILRTVQNIDYENLSIQLDGVDGPIFKHADLPDKVGFYELVVKETAKTRK